MDDSDLDTIFRQLTESMHERGLGWLLDEVRHQIAIGKQVPKMLKPLVEVVPDQDRKRDEKPRFDEKGRKQQFLVTESYSKKEQVELLLDAIELVAVHTPRIEHHILVSLSNVAGDTELQKLEFVDSNGQVSRSISHDQSHAQNSQADRLEGYIRKLRSEINAG